MKRILSILLSLSMAGCATAPHTDLYADGMEGTFNWYRNAAAAYYSRTTPEQQAADQQQDALNQIAWSLDRIARSQQ